MRETLHMTPDAYQDALTLLGACWTSRSSLNIASIVLYLRTLASFISLQF